MREAAVDGREEREHGAVEHGVRHLAPEARRGREGSRQLGGTRRERTAQSKRPTSVSEKEESTYCMRGVGAA